MGKVASTNNKWVNLVDGIYKGFRFHVAIPGSAAPAGDPNAGAPEYHGITREQSTLKARNQVIVRPGVNGAEIVNFGNDPEEYTVDVVFFGDNWQSLYDQFKTVLVDPQPGTLTLPTQSKAVNAAFSNMTALAQVGDGGAKMCTVTWVQNGTVDQSAGNPIPGPGQSLGALATAAAAVTSALVSAQAAVQSGVNAANSTIAASGVLAAIGAAQAGLNTVARFSNIAQSLTQGIQNRIQQIKSNLKNTLALGPAMVASINSLLGISNQNTAGITGAATQASTSGTTAAQTTPTIDPETGQLIVPNTQAAVAAAPNPLQAPDLPANTGITIGDLTSDVAKKALLAQIVGVLQDQSAELNGYVNGAASDIQDSMGPVVNALQNFVNAAVSSSTQTLMTTSELSLSEIMFYNGIGLSQLLVIHQQNPQILDPFVVPVGTVVNL